MGVGSFCFEDGKSESRKAVYPQMTQMDADEERMRENEFRREQGIAGGGFDGMNRMDSMVLGFESMVRRGGGRRSSVYEFEVMEEGRLSADDADGRR